MKTNIKNLPEGHTYFTENGYSQSYPWVEIERTAKTVTLAKIEVSCHNRSSTRRPHTPT